MSSETTIMNLADSIDLPSDLRAEIACLAISLDEPWQDILAEALSELRSLRGHVCDDCACEQQTVVAG